jgi:hypothetical protein
MYSLTMDVGTMFMSETGEFIDPKSLKIGSIFILTHLFTDLDEHISIMKPFNQSFTPKKYKSKRGRKQVERISNKERREIHRQICSGHEVVTKEDYSFFNKRSKLGENKYVIRLKKESGEDISLKPGCTVDCHDGICYCDF